MELERFQRLVDVYGGDDAAWPAGERDAARALLAVEPRARDLQRAARALDEELALFQVASPPPVSRILAARPGPGAVERLLAWMVPAAPLQLWRPALAAMLPLALGVLLGAGLPASLETDGWEQQERLLLAAPGAGETP
ncbi:MAG: hypothetical protein ACX93N_05900 [Pseudohaliea sp.]